MLARLVGYAAYMFGANTLTALLNFGVSALGMATLPKAAFGDYATYMLVYEIGDGLFIYGGNATIQKYAAASDQDRLHLAKLVFLLFFLLLATFGLAAAGAWYAIGFNAALALLGIPWVVTYWYGRYLVRSRLDAAGEARLMMIASLANTFFQLIFLTATDYRDALIYGDFLALIASGAAALVLVPRSMGLGLSKILATPVPRTLLAEALRFGAPLWLAGQVFTAKARLSAVFTSASIGSKAMGSLQAMQTMWQFVSKPSEYLGQASLPGLVAARENRDALFLEVLRLSLVVLPLVALGVAGGLPLLFQVIDLLFALLKDAPVEPLSAKYAEVPVLIMLAALAMPLIALEMVSNQYSVAVGRPRTVFYAQIVNVLVILLALVPLAKTHGVFGVVAAGALGEVGNALVFLVLLRAEHLMVMRTALRYTSWSFVLLAIAMLPIFITRGETWGWAVALPAGALYAAGLFSVRMVSIEDLVRVWRRVRASRSAGLLHR